MARSKQEPIRVLPAKVVPLSEEDFEQVTDLLAELILEKLTRARKEQRTELRETEDEAEH